MKINNNKIKSIEIEDGRLITINYKMNHTDATTFGELPPFCQSVKFEGGDECIVSFILGTTFETEATKDKNNPDRYIKFFHDNV